MEKIYVQSRFFHVAIISRGYLFNSFRDCDMKKVLLALSLVSVFGAVNAAEVAPVVEKQTCEKAVYPKSALMNEETGTVTLGLLIGTDGKVLDSKVENSSGSKSLDKAALQAFSLCKFKPGMKDGKVEQMWLKMDFVWKF